MNIRKFFSCVCVLLCTLFSVLTAKEVQVESKLTADKTLDSAIDLHLTGDAPLAANVKVNLTHTDAWLFFDNVRPLAVLDTYKASVLIDGQPFEPEKNGRISIYKQGTVIIPYGQDIQPLEAFTEADFKGSSAKYAPEFYYSNNPAPEVKSEMKQALSQDNRISSFKLKRGYMATMATEPDGMGYSRCFIADDADLEIRELPAELNGKVSFIRVFQWEWASKKGWVGGNSQTNPPEGYLEDQADVTNSTWVYSWGANADWCRGPENKGTLWRNQEFVPEKWGYGGESDWSVLFNDKRLTHLLSYNEPDHSEHSNVSVSQAIKEWPKHLQTGMRVGSPATTDFGWLYDFMSECNKRNYRVDYVAIHAYWGGSGGSVVVSSVKDWYNKLKEVHEKTGRPLWITEWNNGANWTHETWPSDKAAQQEKQRLFMTEILAMMDTCKFIERYSVYNWVEEKRSLFWQNLNLTPAGKVYANFNAEMAFDRSTEVIPTWTVREAPVLSYQYDKEQNGIMLRWEDVNNELVDGYLVERSVNGSTYTEIGRTESGQVSYIDPLISASLLNGGEVKYRVSSLLGGKVKKMSNIIQYGALNSLASQPFFGRSITSVGQSFYLFGEEYTEKPVMVLGAQTYRMRTPMTTRIGSLTQGACEFGPMLWDYNKNQTFVSKDTLGYMIFPKTGTYQLGGITARAGHVAGVTENAVKVFFDTPFDEVPVVFCSQVTGNSALPTAIRVRNVTREGFEVLLAFEESVAAPVVAEDVCYVAMTQGEGLLNGHRIQVGCTEDAAVTSSSRTPFQIWYGKNYYAPYYAFFGAMQSLYGSPAANLRVLNKGANTIDVFVDYTPSSRTESETVGWCVMETGNATGIYDTQTDDITRMLVYDNGNGKICLLNGGIMPKIDVYSVTGQLLLSRTTVDVLDISNLPAAIYLVRVGNLGSLKIVKSN